MNDWYRPFLHKNWNTLIEQSPFLIFWNRPVTCRQVWLENKLLWLLHQDLEVAFNKEVLRIGWIVCKDIFILLFYCCVTGWTYLNNDEYELVSFSLINIWEAGHSSFKVVCTNWLWLCFLLTIMRKHCNSIKLCV